jgi:hypothetical protein
MTDSLASSGFRFRRLIFDVASSGLHKLVQSSPYFLPSLFCTFFVLTKPIGWQITRQAATLISEGSRFPDFPCEKAPFIADGVLLAPEAKSQGGEVPKEGFVISTANRPKGLVINRGGRAIRNLLQRRGNALSILDAIIRRLVDRLNATSRSVEP